MKYLSFFALTAAIVLLTGCVSYEYSGETGGAETDKVGVFTDSSKISRPYRVLGRAVVSGNYREVSREKMMETMISRAQKCGADAILIVEQQVIPAGEVSRSMFDTAFDFDNTNSSWRQLDRDFDLTYGEVGRKKASKVESVNSYRRIIRAEFLKYTAEEKTSLSAGK